jgi:WD40 repeat protein
MSLLKETPSFDASAWDRLRQRAAAASDPLAVLREDQVGRWTSGSLVPAEEYLRWFPDLVDEDALVLVVGEVGLRRERGEAPRLAEYQARFPRFAEDLRVQFRLLAPLSETLPASHDGATDDPGEPVPGGPAIPGYVVTRELGSGGMGVVYEARDTRLNRVVALKVTRGPLADPRAVIRFRAEAEAVAAVRHPNVVQVYESGDAGGCPFMALEYLPGGTLAGRLGAPGRTPAQAAALLAKVARGVAAAHDQGLVHRDLKPANVLFDEHGEPKVSDFGLVKRAAGFDLTNTGMVMGTPAYMAPEQAAGQARFVGPAADVFSLGVILYELLTGCRPFGGADLHALLDQIRSAEPAPPRQRVPGLPRDIERVCLKCLQKDPADRYPVAKDLADDLDRFVSGEPVAARPAGLLERTYKWAKRKPTLAGVYALALVGAFLLTVTAVVASLWRQAEDASARAASALSDETKAKGQVQDLLGAEKELRGNLESALAGEKAAKAKVESLREKLARLEYARTVDLAHREWGDNNIPRALELLASCQEGLRGWEWHYVHRLCHSDLVTLQGHTKEVTAALWSPDGSKVVTASADGTARVWDANTGQTLVTLQGHKAKVLSVSWSPDGSRIVTTSEDRTARLWDAASGVALTTFQKDIHFHADYVQWSPDRSKVATIDVIIRTARVWDASSGKSLATLEGHKSAVGSVSWSPDGSKIVTGSSDRTARVWDATSGKALLTLEGHTEILESASWSPDGSKVATAGGDRTARVWDANSGKALATLQGHTGPVNTALWSPDGSKVVTISSEHPISTDYTARVWDVNSGKALAVLGGHKLNVTSASWSPDGSKVATASGDRTARVWDANSGKALATLKGHTRGVASVQWSPDGSRILTASEDGTARVWDATSVKERVTLDWHTPRAARASWSPDGTKVVTTSLRETTARVWDASTGKTLATLQGHTREAYSASWSPDGSRVVTASEDGTARVWDANSGKILTTLQGHARGVAYALWSPDGARILTADGDRTARVWDVAAASTIATLGGHKSYVRSASWSPDGSKVGGVSADGTVRVWDANSGKTLTTLQGHMGWVLSASWSPDGSKVAIPSGDGTARVWDAASGKELAILTGHAGSVRWASWSYPDGKRIVTASEDGTAKIWDPETGNDLLTLSGHPGVVYSAEWSPDGTRLLTSGDEGLVMIWDSSPVNLAFIKPPVAAPQRPR